MALLIIAIVIFVAARLAPDVKDGPFNRYRASIEGVAIALALIGIFASAFITIPAGFRGILLQFSAVHGDLSEGPHFIIPIIQSVELMEVRTQKESADAAAASEDLQAVQTKVAINYHVDPLQVGALFKHVGIDYARRVIDPITQESVKAVVAKYTAEELITKREQVKMELDTMLAQRLGAYDILVDPGGVSLTDFEFSPDFNKAIEQKQVAQQLAEQQKYELQKAELQAQTEVASAKGRAQAAQVEAAALNAQGGSKVLARSWIEKWDGHLPTVSGGQGFIIDLKSLLGPVTSTPSGK